MDTLTLVCCVCVFETSHNIIITRSAQKQHHHLRFFVVRDERSNNSIFGVCAEKKTRASGFGGVFFMSFRAATGVRFDKSSVVLSSALSRHHRHRLGARLVRFLLRLRFPSYAKERKKKEESPRQKNNRRSGFWRRLLISSVVEKSLLGERFVSIEKLLRKRERLE